VCAPSYYHVGERVLRKHGGGGAIALTSAHYPAGLTTPRFYDSLVIFDDICGSGERRVPTLHFVVDVCGRNNHPAREKREKTPSKKGFCDGGVFPVIGAVFRCRGGRGTGCLQFFRLLNGAHRNRWCRRTPRRQFAAG
jgi:hypothetical protein